MNELLNFCKKHYKEIFYNFFESYVKFYNKSISCKPYSICLEYETKFAEHTILFGLDKIWGNNIIDIKLNGNLVSKESLAYKNIQKLYKQYLRKIAIEDILN